VNFYNFARSICRFYLKLFRNIKIEGQDNMPQEGPVIVASNHISFLDPVVVGCVFDRQINFIAKEELFHIPILKTIIKRLHAFPVKRGSGDRGALRAALQVLSQGKCFGIFPEGHRNRTKDLITPFKGGAAMIAIKSGAPVLPVAVQGTKGFFSPVRVKIGKPISVPKQIEKIDKNTLTNFNKQLEDALLKLLKELHLQL
jgi:1-acyl-sn-glycerol-3-phosphate acyltransferase